MAVAGLRAGLLGCHHCRYRFDLDRRRALPAAIALIGIRDRVLEALSDPGRIDVFFERHRLAGFRRLERYHVARLRREVENLEHKDGRGLGLVFLCWLHWLLWLLWLLWFVHQGRFRRFKNGFFEVGRVVHGRHGRRRRRGLRRLGDRSLIGFRFRFFFRFWFRFWRLDHLRLRFDERGDVDDATAHFDFRELELFGRSVGVVRRCPPLELDAVTDLADGEPLGCRGEWSQRRKRIAALAATRRYTEDTDTDGNSATEYSERCRRLSQYLPASS